MELTKVKKTKPTRIKKTKPTKVKKIKVKVKMCSYCSYAKALPDDNLCQGCRDMINKASRGFII